MAVTFDAYGGGTAGGGGTSVITTQTAYASPITNAHLTIGATGTLVLGIFSAEDATTHAVATAMTWNGVAMTLITSKASSDNQCAVYVYGLISPTTGLHTLSCTYTNGTGGSPVIDLDCCSFRGTDTTSVAICCPSANVLTDASTCATGPSNYPTTAFTVTTASGDAVFAACDANSAFTANVTIGTLAGHDGASNNNYVSLYNLAAGSTTQAQFHVNSGSSPCCGVAFRIIQPSAGDVLMAQGCM